MTLIVRMNLVSTFSLILRKILILRLFSFALHNYLLIFLLEVADSAPSAPKVSRLLSFQVGTCLALSFLMVSD